MNLIKRENRGVAVPIACPYCYAIFRYNKQESEPIATSVFSQIKTNESVVCPDCGRVISIGGAPGGETV